jgi:hypothetical protein
MGSRKYDDLAGLSVPWLKALCHAHYTVGRAKLQGGGNTFSGPAEIALHGEGVFVDCARAVLQRKNVLFTK